MSTLMAKIKENTNRHFYSAMVYEDLFKALNLPHNDLSKQARDEDNNDDNDDEGKDLKENKESDGDELDMDNDELKPPLKSSNRNDSLTMSTDLNQYELDSTKSNYVQLGITSWSSYINPEIGMYTDLRAYIGWIKRNTQDANYCMNDPSRVIDDKIPMPPKQEMPEKNLNLDCGAEKLNKVIYPWLVSLYFDQDKFIGNCVYFYSTFIICSDIFAEQT